METLFKILFDLFVHRCMYLCQYGYMYICVFKGPQSPEEGIGCLGAGVTGVCDLGVGAELQ